MRPYLEHVQRVVNIEVLLVISLGLSQVVNSTATRWSFPRDLTWLKLFFTPRIRVHEDKLSRTQPLRAA